MATIFKRNDGRSDVWLIEYSWGGKTYRRSLGTKDEREARSLKLQLEKRLLDMASGCTTPDGKRQRTVHELCVEFMAWASKYYKEVYMFSRASGDMVKHHGTLPVSEFTPLKLKALQKLWIQDGLSRTTVNHYTGAVKRIVKWGVSQELVPPSIHQGIITVEGIKRGRTDAVEPEPKKPIPLPHIDAVLGIVPPTLAALIQLQVLTAARPGELVSLRACDIDRTGAIWEARPKTHKGEWLGKDRVIFFGPKAQAIVLEFIKTRQSPADYLFSPLEAQRARWAACSTHRRAPARAKTDRTVGEHYTVSSYRRAIERACETAQVPVWTPHRLRHTAATLIRKQYGLEAAQVFLGHSKADVTQIYAEANKAKAAVIAKEMG